MMISRRFFMTSTLALMAGNMVFSGPAGARTGPDSYATMFEDLGQVPVWMFRQQQAFDIEWGDAEAITAAIGQNWAEDIPPAFARQMAPFQRDLLFLGLKGDWLPVVGFDPTDIRRSIMVRRPPLEANLLFMRPGLSTQISESLKASGYTTDDATLAGALTNGQEDLLLNRELPARAPFSGVLGRSSRILIRGDEILHSHDWQTLTSLADTKNTGNPVLPRLHRAVDLAEFAGLVPLNAMVLTYQPDLGDPRRILNPDAPPPPKGAGLPLWDLALMIDLADPNKPLDLTQILLAFPTEAMARDAAERMTRTWQQMVESKMPELDGVEIISTDIRVSDSEPTVAIFTLGTPRVTTGSWRGNSGYEKFNKMSAMRSLYLTAGQ